jgi:iron complex outermembrane receptor protein
MVRNDLIRRYVALALIGATSTALAQTASPPPAADSDLQEIVVTGSLIKRVNAETAEAITIVKMDTLKDMGVTSVEQALALVTSNNASGVTTSSNVAAFNGGASFASLRGLGGSRTLILLDGERLASNVNFGGAVDLNTIPFAAIDHIEVLREGASSEYGSDAIAGVINFITKKDYSGGEVNVNYSRPQHAGGASDNVDLTYGIGNLASDGYNLMITANVAGQQELVASQRSFAATGYDPAASLANFNGPYGPWPGSYQDANGSLWQVGYPQCAGNPHLAAVNGSCQYEYSGAVDLIPADKSQSGLISFTKSLPGNNSLSIQYFFARFDLQTWGGPQEYFFTVDPSSPYYPTAGESSCVGTCSTTTPALGGPVPAGWTDPNNNRYFENVNTEQRAVLTFKGSNAGWDYAASFNWSQNKGVQQVRGGEANYALLAPGGTLSNLINPFGPQSAAGQALINSAYQEGDLEIGTLSLYELGAHASHPLGDLFDAGRPAAFAVGVDYKDEEITNQPTPLATTLYTATYYPPFSIAGARVSEAAYVELNVPVSKDAEFTVSDRQDRYSDFGTTNNAKISFAYQPFSALKFRGAASTGFRAPSLVDLYSPQTFGATQGNIYNPTYCSPGNYTTVYSQLNCISQGLALYGGNPNLTAETSQNFDLGMIISPVANLGITLDYYRVIIKNSIGTVPPPTIYASPTAFAADFVLNNAGTLSPASASNLECPTPKAATCGYIIDTKANTGGTVTDGFDLSVNYLLSTDYGKFRLGLEGTFVTDFKVQQYTGGPEVDILGQWSDFVAPVIRWQHLATVDWTFDRFGAGLSHQFTEHYGDEFPNAAGNAITVGNYSLFNGYVSFKPIESLKLLLGINNILDTNPPFSNQNQNWQSGYNPIESSPLGRAFYVKANWKF